MKSLNRYLITTRPTQKTVTVGKQGCFEVLNIPVTELTPNDNFDLSELDQFDPGIAIFTSSYGVDLFFDHFHGKLQKGVIVISIGESTSNSLKRWGIKSILPMEKTSQGVVDSLENILHKNAKIALFVSSKSNRIIQSYLEEKKIEHKVTVLYIANPVAGDEFRNNALKTDCFGIVVTSSFEARTIFDEIFNDDETALLLEKRRIFSIGNTTTKELERLKIPISPPNGESDLGKLLNDIQKMYCN